MRQIFTVLRIAKLKTWSAVAGAGKHNQRERETPNADIAKASNNRYLVGQGGMDIVAATKEVIGGQRIRKNAVLGVEMLLSASPQYFRPDSPEQAGTYDNTRLQNWTQATMNWLHEKYSKQMISAVLHLDEATPHIHVVLVPLDDKGKLNCRALFGGSKHTLSALQTDYSQAVSSLGIERGIENSRTTHQKVSQFYTLTQQKNSPQVPLVSRCNTPEMPNKLARMSDEQLKIYARQAALNGAEAQRDTLEPIISAVHNENAILKREIINLKRANFQLAKEKTELQKQANLFRGIEPGTVLQKMFNAKGPYSKDGQQRYLLPGDRDVFVSGTRWQLDSGSRGKGAIDLVMSIRGYTQQDMHKALGELSHSFGKEKVVGEFAEKALVQAAETVRKAERLFTPERKKQQEISR